MRSCCVQGRKINDLVCVIRLKFRDLHVGEILKATSTQMDTSFKTDFINNMDHMLISGNEPSSVILSQTKLFQKLK